MDRRQFFTTSAAAAAATTSIGTASAAEAPSLKGPYLDLTTGKGCMLMQARMNGNLDETKTKYGTATGFISAVRAGEKVQDLFGFEVFGVGKAEKQPDGSYRVYHRETILYTDLATGNIIDDYMNPYTSERVRVVHVYNDPWNEYFEEFEPRPPSYGGLNKVDTTSPRKPFIQNWRVIGGGMIISERHINLFYPSALQPDKWPRESTGKMNQVSECYTYVCRIEDAQNPKLTSLENTGTWSRVTPWLPWMLMGQAPGHVLYQSTVAHFDDFNNVKKNVRDYIGKHRPEMLEAPPKSSWEKKNLSSLEVYAETEKPQPAKPKI